MKMRPCRRCGQSYPSNMTRCPNCGTAAKPRGASTALAIGMPILIVSIRLGAFYLWQNRHTLFAPSPKPSGNASTLSEAAQGLAPVDAKLPELDTSNLAKDVSLEDLAKQFRKGKIYFTSYVCRGDYENGLFPSDEIKDSLEQASELDLQIGKDGSWSMTCDLGGRPHYLLSSEDYLSFSEKNPLRIPELRKAAFQIRYTGREQGLNVPIELLLEAAVHDSGNGLYLRGNLGIRSESPKGAFLLSAYFDCQAQDSSH